MSSTDLAAAAIEYMSVGLQVIALTGKQPNASIHRHGLREPLQGTIETEEDVRTVERVFAHADTTGVGIVIPPHLVVVDIDGPAGADLYIELTGIDPSNMPVTPAAITGRGLHLWFVSPEERRSARLGDKLDIKGAGGYVAAPPSIHPDGHRYTWIDPLVKSGIIGPTDWLPAPIERMLDDRQRIQQIGFRGATAQQGGSMDGLARAVQHAEEGNRNHMLYWAACSARDSGFAYKDAVEVLGKASTLTTQESVRTIRSAYEDRRG